MTHRFLGAILAISLVFPFAVRAQDAGNSFFLVRPFLGRPTHSSIVMNLVAGEKDVVCHVKFRAENDTWQKTADISIPALSPVEIKLEPLKPGTLYIYQLYARFKEGQGYRLVTENEFRTQLTDASGFAFAIVSDSHITQSYPDRMEVLSLISASITARKPDFLFMLGDNIQTFTSHGGPMARSDMGPYLYMLLRRALGDLPSAAPVFTANGNWEGENGWHPERQRQWAKNARMAFIPNPNDKTYPEGGSPDEDYYGFTWGNVLFLVLNVTGYTPTDHALTSTVGRSDDWTLGKAQKKWLYGRLSESNAKWKLLFIHHTVGGNAGDDVNSRYGRGGGRAARIGEQKVIHNWMIKFGVQALFYGHDHVFTDIPVDGIHYICVGSAGAPWKFGTEVTGYKQFWTPSGFTWVDVGPDALKISFVQPDSKIAIGKVMHTFIVPQVKNSKK